MSESYTEEHYENSLIELFEGMGYRHVYGPDVERDYTCPLYLEELDEALARLNPTLPPAAIREARRKLLHFENGSLVQQNTVFTDYLQNGIEVKYFDGKTSKTPRVYLADFVHPERGQSVDVYGKQHEAAGYPALSERAPGGADGAEVTVSGGDGCFGGVPADTELHAGNPVHVHL